MATTSYNSGDSSIDTDLVEKYVTEDGSTIETRETDDGTIEEQCPTCGNWYERVGTHWGRSSCQYPQISKRKWEMCKGLMMGDGCLGLRDSENCRLEIGNTNVTFLEYLEDEFGWLASTLFMNKTAKESAKQVNGREIDGEVRNTDTTDYQDAYKLNTRSHSLFNHFEEWWEMGEKVFPHIQYTKPLLRMWWISDGTFDWTVTRNSKVQFCSVNESTRPQNIIQSFADCDFDCSLYGDNKFSLPVDQTEDFFDYIGHDSVPGFEYKWAWQDRDRYERLMKEGKGKHHTQTLE